MVIVKESTNQAIGKCKHCKKEFVKNNNVHKYCSAECRTKDNPHIYKQPKDPTFKNQTYIKVCKHCKKSFGTQLTIQIYCNDKCRVNAYKEKNKKCEDTTIRCKNCEQTFENGWTNQVYCSVSCREEYYKRIAEEKRKNIGTFRQCKNCGNKFVIDASKHQSGQKYCDEKCRNEFYKNNASVFSEDTLKETIEFRVKAILEKAKSTQPKTSMGVVISEFVLDSFTETIKENIRKRDGYRCQICEVENERLEVHHILRRRLGGTNEPDNLITLCVKCHRAIETNDEKHAINICYKNARKVGGQNLGEQLTNPEKISSLRFCLEGVFDDIANDNEFDRNELLLKISNALSQTE